MEGRIRSLLLSCAAIILSLSFTQLNAADLAEDLVSKPIIQPEIERMDFEESRINSDNYEIIATVGLLSIEDFGVNPVIGAKLAYRVSEGFFVGAEMGLSTAGETSAESILNINILSDDERDLSYFLINLGYDLFPGEIFVTDGITYNSAVYIIAGLGNTEFAGSDNFTFSWGAGFRLYPTNSVAIYLDVRDHTFNMDLLGDKKLTNNFEVSFGLGIYF